MADDNYSSLRQAIDKIVGVPAGGTPATQDIMELAPKAPYSQDLQTAAPGGMGTTAGASNTPYDPAAAQAAAQAAVESAAAAAAAPAVSTAAPASVMPDYKNYQEYYAGNPEALSRSNYMGRAGEPLGTTAGEGLKWGKAGNPYQYRNKYNKYLAALPAEYQALGKSNITGEAVRKGLITGVYDPATRKTYSVGPGVAPGTVQPGSSQPAAAAPVAPPVKPGPRASWQKSQQYWKDLAAYTQAGGK